MESKVVVITGCSSGIGKNLAETLADRGYRVVATARNADTIKALKVALTLSLDVTRQESVDAAIRKILEKFGKIDVLVNNAGHSVRAAVEETDETLAREMFDVNVWGLLRVTKAVLPSMRLNGNAQIIFVGSVMGKFVFPLNGSYAASKHAIEALADAMRVELMPFNVGVTMIEPGTIKSNFFDSSKAKSRSMSENRDSPYTSFYEHFFIMADRPSFQGADPDRVSHVILKAIEAKNPKPRYLAAVSAIYRLLLALNDRSRDRLLAKSFGVKKASSTNFKG